MQDKNKKRTTNIREVVSDVLIWVLLGFVVLLVVLSVVHFGLRKEAGTLITTECEVVDKYRRDGVGLYDRSSDSYHLTLLFDEGTTKYTKTVEISKQSFYEDIKIGDMVLCDVIYDENGVVEIEITDKSIEQFTTTDALKTGLIVILVVGAVGWAIVGAFVLYFKRGDKKTS